MSKFITSFFGLILGLLFLTLPAFGQKSGDLKKKRDELQKKIEYTNKLINSTVKNQRSSISQLNLIKQKINFRQQKIRTIKREIEELDGLIVEKASLIEAYEMDLEQLKQEYAKIVLETYKGRDVYDRLVFLFSAQDINQAYKRLKYMQLYSDSRELQAKTINELKIILRAESETLEKKKQDRVDLISLMEKDRESLHGDRLTKQKALNKLKYEENRLRKRLKQQEKDKQALNKAIASAIRKEIESQKKKNKGTFKLTPEGQKLSASFERNKGKLPWPVKRGIITKGFGEHTHPTIKGLKENNNGIDIATEKGAMVRAVFEGEVISIIVISGAGKTVMVKHGGFYTTYSNLKETLVSKGDKVTTKQDIGVLLTDKRSKTEVHFEIWNVTSKGEMLKLNPASWIYKK